MIIKGVLRRYERWNPVHPTCGAFWGMGIGIGCGVGWGPGFGPDVVGYVGAGCGIGFSVGITLAGVGVGLPLPFNVLYHHAFNTSKNGAMDVARSTLVLSSKFTPEVGWNALVALPRQATARLSSMLPFQPASIWESFARFHRGKGAGND